MTIPRHRHLGTRDGPEPVDEREHFMRCPECGGWFDMRDLGQVAEHMREGHEKPKGDA